MTRMDFGLPPAVIRMKARRAHQDHLVWMAQRADAIPYMHQASNPYLGASNLNPMGAPMDFERALERAV